MSPDKIKVYLSASLQDKETVMKFMDNIDNAHKGMYEVTCRWWDLDDNDAITNALLCMQGVDDCKIFIMYNGKKKTTGKSIELGMALHAGKIIKIYGEPLTTQFRSLVKHCGNMLPDNLNDMV